LTDPIGEGLAADSMTSIDLADGRGLDRIANRGAGAVRFDIVNLIGGKPRAPQHLPQQIRWPSPLGIVMPVLRPPSVLIPVARMTAWMESPSASALSSGFSRTDRRLQPAHSVGGRIESAAAGRSPRASKPCEADERIRISSRLTPPTSAVAASPARRLFAGLVQSDER